MAKAKAGNSGSPKKLKMCINGEWKDSATTEYMPCYNPSTGEVIAQAPKCTLDEVNAAVAAAAAAYPAWSNTPITKRVQVMFKFKEILDRNLDELSVGLATEMGKNLAEARGDVLKAIEVVELACSVPALMAGYSLSQVSTGFDTVANRLPLGVFVAVAVGGSGSRVGVSEVSLGDSARNTCWLAAGPSWANMKPTIPKTAPTCRSIWAGQGVLNASLLSRFGGGSTRVP